MARLCMGIIFFSVHAFSMGPNENCRESTPCIQTNLGSENNNLEQLNESNIENKKPKPLDWWETAEPKKPAPKTYILPLPKQR